MKVQAISDPDITKTSGRTGSNGVTVIPGCRIAIAQLCYTSLLCIRANLNFPTANQKAKLPP